ncbi:MAG: PilZ domain-containing protein [Smithella sp.]|nr:PilZ domain-containing protein [Smithella sp.]
MKEKIIDKREKKGKKDQEDLEKKAARKAERLDEENQINIKILSGLTHLSNKEISYNYSEDISMTGTRIKGNVLLPIDTFLEIDLILKNSKQKVTVFGKVKWSKVVEEGQTYEAGVEFVDTPDESIKKLGDYILSINQYKELNPVGVPYWIFEKFNKPPS